MTDTIPEIDMPPYPDAPDFTLPIVIYVLFILGGFMGFVPSVIGVILAHIQMGAATGAVRSHYGFQIRTFWISVGIFVVGLMLSALFFGSALLHALSVLDAVRTGTDGWSGAMTIGGLIAAAVWMGMLVVFLFFFNLIRAVIGLVRAAQRQAIAVAA